MKILLQSTKTFKFIREHQHRSREVWTAEQANARIFATATEAVYHCYQRGIAHMQMFVAFDDSERDFTVSVTGTLTA
jgi:hypothetical protein